MFLSHLASLGFVKSDTNATGFANFPVVKRKTIAQEVVELCYGETVDSEITSEGSARTLFDCLGQALSLPIEEHETIIAVINIYRGWLLGKNRPSVLGPSYDEDIIKQLSIVFESRPNTSPSFSTSSIGNFHIEMCKLVLSTLVEVCRAKKLLSNVTLALKVILGIVDYLLSEEMVESLNYFGSKLDACVLSTFFDILFASHTQDEAIWGTLAQLAQKWKHKTPLVTQWAHISYMLTACLIRSLYGPQHGADFSLEDGDGEVVIMPLDDHFTRFCWHKIFYLLGDLETIIAPNNYLFAIRGIGRIIDLFLKESSNKMASSIPIDGSSVLHIVGQYLFKAISRFGEYKFDSGKAEAIQILMRIFEEKYYSVFSNTYLVWFYNSLKQALVRNIYLLGVVLTCTTSLFQLEMPGCYDLIPVYIQSIQYILSYSQSTMEGLSVPLHELKLSCMRILGYFCSMPAHLYRQQQSTAIGDFKLNKELSEVEELLVYIPQLVLDTLRKSTYDINQDLCSACLQLGFVFISETLELSNCASFPSQFINLIINRIESSLSGWEIQTISLGCKILAQLAEYQHSPVLCQGDLKSSVIINLCKLVKIHCTIEFRNEFSDQIILDIIDTILSWTLSAQDSAWIPIVDTLNIAAQSKSINHENSFVASLKVKLSAQCAIEQLHYKMLYLSTCVNYSETEYLKKEGLSIKNATCFIAWNTIISIVSHPRNKATNTIKIAVFLRLIGGTFFWEKEVNELAYDGIFGIECNNNNDSSHNQQNAIVSTQSGPGSPKLNKTASTSRKLKNWLTSTAQHARQKIKHKKISSSSMTLPPPITTVQDHIAIQKILTDLGLISSPFFSSSPKSTAVATDAHSLYSSQELVYSRANFNFIDLPSPDAFDHMFGLLDHLLPRECYEIAVLYIPSTFSLSPTSHHLDELFDITEGSMLFEDFAQAIGWKVQTTEHTGYSGQIWSTILPDYIESSIYYANNSVEVMYRVSTYLARFRKSTLPVALLPQIDISDFSSSSELSCFTDDHDTLQDNEEPKSQKKTVGEEKNFNSLAARKKLILFPKVVILWQETPKPTLHLSSPPRYYTGTELVHTAIGSRALVAIIISPLKSGRFHVQIVKKPTLIIGPLRDGMVVTQQQLPSLVRSTAISACRALYDPDDPKPYEIRKQVIDDIITKAKPN